MSKNDPIARKAQQFFKSYLADQTIDDVDGLAGLLPREPEELYALVAHCIREGRKALDAGLDLEAHRLGILASQLQYRAEQNRLPQ